jgi:hypothetical protein
MGRRNDKNKNKARRPKASESFNVPQSLEGMGWVDSDGIHTLLSGTPPDPLTLELLTRAYQQQIRNSPLWDEMVREFGPLKAEALLKQCRAQLG